MIEYSVRVFYQEHMTSEMIKVKVNVFKAVDYMMYQALALRRRSDEGLTLETSAFESLYGG